MVDPITLQVVAASLTGIVQEMQISLFRTGYSTAVRESQDGSCAILNADGQLIAQHVVLPLHMGAFPACTQAVLKAYSTGEIRPGDAFVINHPYVGGSPHAPDFCVVVPVFASERLAAFCGTIAHKTDIGGTVPGSCSGQAREIFHEGLHLPAVRYAVGGEILRDIEAVIGANSRAPEVVCGDLRGQLGACRIGERRVQAAMQRYGAETVLEAAERSCAITAAKLRESIALWPDGEFEGESFMDDDGVDVGNPVRVHVRVTKRGESIGFDFSASADQTRGPANLRPPLVRAACSFCLACMVSPAPATNHGLLGVPEIVVREGSLLNPRWPAPVSGYVQTSHALVEAVLLALGQMVPGRRIAPGCGTRSITVAGTNPDTGQQFVQYEIFGGGAGATSFRDGVSGTSINHSNSRIASIEIVETEFPVRAREFRLLADSGGAGRYRGGLGFVREYEILAEEARFSVRAGKHLKPARGVEGGGDGRPGACIVNPGTERERALPSRYADLRLVRGDVVRLETPGGGGFGRPQERETALIERDLVEGFVTHEGLRKAQGGE